jgi:hypothetical protein
MEQSKHVSPSERQIPRLAKFVVSLDLGSLVTYTKKCLKIQFGFYVQIILY